MLRLYDSRLSGNAWKVRILLTQLGLRFERITLDLAKGATADPAFRAKSRFARIPVLELEDGRTIVESVRTGAFHTRTRSRASRSCCTWRCAVITW